MKKQDKKSSEEKLREKYEQALKEIHNLKRQNKRLKQSKTFNQPKEEASKNTASRVDEVTAENMDDIKKKLRAQNLSEKEIDVMCSVMFQDIDSQNK